jgi:hypothetical protein
MMSAEVFAYVYLNFSFADEHGRSNSRAAYRQGLDARGCNAMGHAMVVAEQEGVPVVRSVQR